MKELTYDEAIKKYGEEYKFNKKFILVKDGDAKLFVIDDFSFAIIKHNEKHNMNEVIFSNDLKINEKVLKDIYDSYGEFIISILKDYEDLYHYEIIEEKHIPLPDYLMQFFDEEESVNIDYTEHFNVYKVTY